MNITEHLLTCLGEEGAEIAQICSKSTRFGLADRNVLNPTGPTNQERLVGELNDLLGVCDMLVRAGKLPKRWMNTRARKAKAAKVRKFMRYAARKRLRNRKAYKSHAVLVHEGSGIPVAYGDDEAEALRIAKPLLATEKILRAALYEAAEELKVGPKPKVKVTR